MRLHRPHLIKRVRSHASSLISLNALLKELNKHLQAYPSASSLLARENVLKKLLRIRQLSDQKLGVLAEPARRHLRVVLQAALAAHPEPASALATRVAAMMPDTERGP